MQPTTHFDTASVALLKEVAARLRSMEQRQIRIETRLCRFIHAEGKGELVHAKGEPATEDALP